MLPEIIVDTVPGLAGTLAARLEGEGGRALAERGRFALALPGGSVARAFFPRLARASFDWSHAEFFWGDERSVPATDPDSNVGLARALWLDPAHVPAHRVHAMEADTADLARAAEAYAGDLVNTLGIPPRLDVVLLGTGADGHVGSLFPGRHLLSAEPQWVGFETAAPVPPARRLTLTLSTLGEAGLIVVAAFGETKAEAIGAALHDTASSTPLALALRRSRRALVLLDRAAARLVG
jgi:6-phosphogluconolactonase